MGCFYFYHNGLVITVVPFYLRFHFAWLWLCRSQLQSKSVTWKNSRNKQFMHFKLLAVLSSMTKSRTVLIRPALYVNHPFVQCFHALQSLSSHLGYQGIAVLAFISPLFYLVMSPKHKSSDVGHSGMPKRSCKRFPENEKVCVYARKQHVQGFGTIHDFRHPLGALGRIPHG